MQFGPAFFLPAFTEDLGMKVLLDKGQLVVAILDGDGARKVRFGTRQSAGKEKAP